LSIPSDTTGTFEDTTNTDQLVPGDLFNYSVDVPAEAGSNALTLTTISTIFDHAANLATWQSVEAGSSSVPVWTVSNPLPAADVATTNSVTEANVQRIMRTRAVLSNFRMYVSANTATSANVNTRINGANGVAQISVGLGATGAFTDTTSIDIVPEGAALNYAITLTAGASISVSFLNCTGDGCLLMVAGAGSAVSYTTTKYNSLVGPLQTTGPSEAAVRVKARYAALFRHLYVIATANAAVTASMVSLRSSGVSKISVSIAAAATGTFEETTLTYRPAVNDTVNYEIAKGDAGALVIRQVSLEQVPDPAALPKGSAGLWMYRAGRSLL
jgi:hypothetical protein